MSSSEFEELPQDSASQSAGPSGAGQSSDQLIIGELRRMESSLSSTIKAVSDRVDRLSETVYGPPAKKRPAESGQGHWADRQDQAPDTAIHWSDEEGEGDGESSALGTIKLSEYSESLLSSSFTTTLPNVERRKIRNAFPTPEVQQTRCPRLDSIFKSSSIKSEVKTCDAELARVQAFVLDPVVPLTNMLHHLENEEYSVEDARSDLTDALRLLGNASAQISRIRRKKVIKALNPDIQDLAEEDELYKCAAPYLFGTGFEQRMKDRAESIKLLTKAKAPPPKKFFRAGRSTVPRGGGGRYNRGGRSWQKNEKPASSK